MKEKEFFEICEEHGWSAKKIYTNGKDADYELEKYVDEQDVVQYIQVTGSFADSMRNLYECYDPDQEAYLWLGDDGHGKNGAPYRMRDVLEDMEEVEREIEALYRAVLSIETSDAE